MDNQESEFVQHEPCPACRKRGEDVNGDNLARYSDGHAYCNACGHYEKGDGTSSKAARSVKRNPKLLTGLDFVPLKKRGIDGNTCKKFNYGVSTYGRDKTTCQVAEYRDKQGNVVAQHIRMPGKEFRWIGETDDLCLFGQHLWPSSGKRIIITEGEIDCLTISMLQDNKWPVVSLPNGANAAAKSIKHNLEFLEGYETVVLAFDMDEPGRKAAKECAMLLSPGKAKIAHLPYKDANECLQEGQGKELLSCLWDAQSFRPDGIVSGKDLWLKVKEPPAKGMSIPYPDLNNMLDGLRHGELYLFTAGSGIGKSTLVNEIAYHLKTRHDQTLGVIALEESTDRNLRRYMGIWMNKPIWLPEVHESLSEKELREAFDAVTADGKWYAYDHFGSSNIDTLLAKIRYMIVALGCRVVVLDHISIVVSALDEADGESERKTIDKLMTKMRSLIEETGAMVLAVVHLKRPDKGKSYNEGRQVSLTDLRGSGSLEQLSDVVIALERDQQGDSPNLSHIRILKNRPTGLVGPAGSVEYDTEKGRLLSKDAEEFGFTKEEDDNGEF